MVYWIFAATWWILMSKRFRICMTKDVFSFPQEQIRLQFSKYRFQNKSALVHNRWEAADSFWNRYLENCGRACFFGHLIILLTDCISSHSPNFGRPKQGQTFVVPTFHIHFLNPECVRIPWVLTPKNFPVENFRVWCDLQKKSIFHWFLCPQTKKSIGLVYPQFWCHTPSQ